MSSETQLSFWIGLIFLDLILQYNTNLLLAECEVRTASYEPSFFLPFMA